MKDQTIVFEGLQDERHQIVFSHKYSPQEIKNCNVEILHTVSTKQQKHQQQIKMYRSILPLIWYKIFLKKILFDKIRTFLLFHYKDNKPQA